MLNLYSMGPKFCLGHLGQLVIVGVAAFQLTVLVHNLRHELARHKKVEKQSHHSTLAVL